MFAVGVAEVGVVLDDGVEIKDGPNGEDKEVEEVEEVVDKEGAIPGLGMVDARLLFMLPDRDKLPLVRVGVVTVLPLAGGP